jgi:hypothetical protein
MVILTGTNATEPVVVRAPGRSWIGIWLIIRRFTDMNLRTMIKALLLIFLPVPTWEHIAAAQRKWTTVFFAHFLPWLITVSAVEGFGLVHWGKPRGTVARVVQFPVAEAVVYELFTVLIWLAVVFVLARLIKSLGETFHGRHSFRQAFSVAAYGLAPMLLLRTLDAFPAISPWITWPIGLFLSAGALYHGIPKVMQPDPPHTFGLFLMTVLLLTLVTGLFRFVTAWYLAGKFPKLDALITATAKLLPL